MNKDEYFLRSISKIRHKKWELYVITRILHFLNDNNIEYICQQYINPPGNKEYYLADICFPSLETYCEIDELQHSKEEHIFDDLIRQREILEATDWIEKRIKIYDDNLKVKSLDEINSQVEIFISFLRKRKAELERSRNSKILWNFEDKYNPDIHMKKGIIHTKDNVVFRNHKDALKLFGYNKGHHQRAVWNIKGKNEYVWFPKLYRNNSWNNKLLDGGNRISQEMIVNNKAVSFKLWDSNKKLNHKMIVFAHYKNILGQTVYKFYGRYETDWKNSNELKQFMNRTDKQINLTEYQI
tara:strand:- start:216 stop:1106 length:891 start_codon:yes stop_codon:yes gene_type:complete